MKTVVTNADNKVVTNKMRD